MIDIKRLDNIVVEVCPGVEIMIKVDTTIDDNIVKGNVVFARVDLSKCSEDHIDDISYTE